MFFRGLNVGTVLGWDVSHMAENVTIHAFIRAPFDSYVHEGSRFWNASGLSVKMGAQGLQVEIESFKALLLGGIAFDTPEEALKTPAGAENQPFPLYANAEAATMRRFAAGSPRSATFPDRWRGSPPARWSPSMGSGSAA